MFYLLNHYVNISFHYYRHKGGYDLFFSYLTEFYLSSRCFYSKNLSFVIWDINVKLSGNVPYYIKKFCRKELKINLKKNYKNNKQQKLVSFYFLQFISTEF